ncbi:MAG: hypothetical protein J7L04_09175 [Bacteroidales bacterium]|nr:hypothetical protein [Bacteroidales bacterium]
MAQGIIYHPTLVKLLSGLKSKNQSVIFKMEDGSLKTLEEVKDFHNVKSALKPEVIVDHLLLELFGDNPKSKSGLKSKHFDAFMALFEVVLDNTAPAVIKSISEKYDLTISKNDEGNGKIASEMLRE